MAGAIQRYTAVLSPLVSTNCHRTRGTALGPRALRALNSATEDQLDGLLGNILEGVRAMCGVNGDTDSDEVEIACCQLSHLRLKSATNAGNVPRSLR